MKKLRILVIDDSEQQRKVAITQLNEYEVITADGWNVGEYAIKNGGWDIALIDLSMPAVGDNLGDAGQHWVGKPTPYGFPLALFALKNGVPKVAIVSNGNAECNHHAEPIYNACDCINGIIIPGRLWAFTGYDCPAVRGSKEIKNWAKVVEILGQK